MITTLSLPSSFLSLAARIGKLKRRKPEDGQVCPLCSAPLEGTVEEMNKHVEECLLKVASQTRALQSLWIFRVHAVSSLPAPFPGRQLLQQYYTSSEMPHKNITSDANYTRSSSHMTVSRGSRTAIILSWKESSSFCTTYPCRTYERLGEGGFLNPLKRSSPFLFLKWVYCVWKLLPHHPNIKWFRMQHLPIHSSLIQ